MLMEKLPEQRPAAPPPIDRKGGFGGRTTNEEFFDRGGRRADGRAGSLRKSCFTLRVDTPCVLQFCVTHSVRQLDGFMDGAPCRVCVLLWIGNSDDIARLRK